MFRVLIAATMISLCSAFNTPLIDRFNAWAEQFKIRFTCDEHAYQVYQKWAVNDRYITDFNSQNRTFQLGHNQFSGFDTADYRKYLWGGNFDYDYENFAARRRGSDIKAAADPVPDHLPQAVDWVETGAVTPVKDQGQCGSCWSFSTTGALEGAYFIKYGKLASFSEQQLVDCDNLRHGGRDHGCQGGLMDNAFNWISKNGGLCTESDYPYVSGETLESGSCDKSCIVDKNSKVVSYVDVPPDSNPDMKNALSKGPVSVAIEADQIEFQLYKSGVFTGNCGTDLDHGVLAVGYGSENGLSYYKIKNSWGEEWGEKGYMRMLEGSCGILKSASYVKV